jgi:hypothetical protein
VKMDRTEERALKMLELTRAGGSGFSGMELRAEALLLALEDEPADLRTEAVKLAWEAMALGDQMCDVFAITGDKQDTHIAECYFRLAGRLDPEIAEVAGKKRAKVCN